MSDGGTSGSGSGDGSGSGNLQMSKRLGVASVLATTGMGLSGLLNRGAMRVDFLGSQLVAGESIGAFMTVGRMGMGLVLFVVLLFATRKVGLFWVVRLSPAIVFSGLSVGLVLVASTPEFPQ